MSIDDKELIQLTYKDVAEIRVKLHKEQQNICPILKKEFDNSVMVLDHQHRRKNSTIGKNGGGLVRGVIHFQANSFEGKVTNAFKRLGLDKFGIDLPDLLINLAEYLKKDNLPLIHPTEKPKGKTLGKRLYTKIAKAYKEKYPKKTIPPYPEKRPILNSKWLKIIEDLDIKL